MNSPDRNQPSLSGWELPLFETKADAVKIICGSILGAVAAIYCFAAAASVKPDATASVLLCIFSMLVGWILGIAITPSSSGEKSRFSEYGKALVAAATGFLAGQLKDITTFLSLFFAKQTSEFSATAGLLAGCCFLIGLLFTFIFRSYVRGSAAELEEKRRKATTALREAVEKLAAVDRNDT
jgi:hypothetical protein